MLTEHQPRIKTVGGYEAAARYFQAQQFMASGFSIWGRARASRHD
jgi:hypothetical protein